MLSRNDLIRSSEKVTLVMRKKADVFELYGVAEVALDEKATLRRVAKFYRGTGKYPLTAEEQELALEILHRRADEIAHGHGASGFSPRI